MPQHVFIGVPSTVMFAGAAAQALPGVADSQFFLNSLSSLSLLPDSPLVGIRFSLQGVCSLG